MLCAPMIIPNVHVETHVVNFLQAVMAVVPYHMLFVAVMESTAVPMDTPVFWEPGTVKSESRFLASKINDGRLWTNYHIGMDSDFTSFNVTIP